MSFSELIRSDMFFMVAIKGLEWARKHSGGWGGGRAPPAAALDVCWKSKGLHEE